MTPSFKAELHELIDKYRDHPGTCLEELVDAMETEVEVLVDQINERATGGLMATSARLTKLPGAPQMGSR